MLYVKFDSQKTQKSRLGYWRPGVRISTLRPKREKRVLAVLFSFFVGVSDENFTLRSRMEFVFQTKPSKACFSAASAEILHQGSTSTLRPKSAFCTRKTAYFAGFRLFFLCFLIIGRSPFYPLLEHQKKRRILETDFGGLCAAFLTFFAKTIFFVFSDAIFEG